MLTKHDNYSVWFSRDDDGRTQVAVSTVQASGQVELVAAEEFGPFDTDEDIVAWVWAKLQLDIVGHL